MKLYSAEIRIEAPISRVWPILADVENWPNWADSFETITKLSDCQTGLGTKVTIKQPKLSPNQWTITEWVEGGSFKWVSRQFGLTVTGDHILRDHGNQCSFYQELRFEGLLSGLTASFAGALITDYMTREAAGLKRASEQLQKR
jgi:Polyketide cyclase / dehydrase and lipid transport